MAGQVVYCLGMVVAHTGCLGHKLCSAGGGQWLVVTSVVLLWFVERLYGADFLVCGMVCGAGTWWWLLRSGGQVAVGYF